MVYCCTLIASSVNVVACKWESCVCVPVMIGSSLGIWGFMDLIITGSAFSFITALAQLNCGSKVASQGYPRTRSSFPMFVTRNHMVL